ncbi:hypothetical protein B0A55_11364 [Friedmanniomyces simplex]|uniref:DUF218 domain-containing protein n=1 Tax=Friedmanniomyces simplex TaxID=329884 RepID=A0A4U0WIW8_9PEZI|nr:hypothetical protein B0A55_11364 [Friedmanniomyces simplex]
MGMDGNQEGDFSACKKLVVDWLLQSFQQSDPSTHKPSEAGTFLTHILTGASLCNAEPNAMLMFSGGRTTTSDRSEAEGYNRIFHTLLLNKLVPIPALPYVKEEHATDSYQNLLFSILRFRELVGQYPEDVVVVTHAFKERRFLELHVPAIKWPPGRIRVQGINPPFTLEELQQTQKLEHERAYELFVQDPYGMRSPLADKRRARNWDPAVARSLAAEGPVEQLLEWNGGESGREIFAGKLPWEEG